MDASKANEPRSAVRFLLLAWTQSLISLVGTVLATISALVILSLLGLHLAGFAGSPYLDFVVFVAMPAVLVVGLALVPLGVWRRRRATNGGSLPVIDLNVPRTRRALLVVAVLSAANVVVIAGATFKGVEVMDSSAFCGTACHSVMGPQSAAHGRSTHSRVRCTSCHVGEGIGSSLTSKAAGVRRLVSTAFRSYPKPIRTALEGVRPAADTCEACHTPFTYGEERLKVHSRFDSDESQTEKKTVLLLDIGGVQSGKSRGIHWHADPAVRIRYLTDAKREHVADVELTLPTGESRVYRTQEGTKASASEMAWRAMDCMDCHNRLAHAFGRPEDEVDKALASGRIDKTLPYVRREGLKLLTTPYGSHAEARTRIAGALGAFYAQGYAELARARAKDIASAADALGSIYAANAHPTMNIGWNAYPSSLPHDNTPGCFRCHDDGHKTPDGKLIGKGCTKCHQVLATDEEDPDILKELHE